MRIWQKHRLRWLNAGLMAALLVVAWSRWSQANASSEKKQQMPPSATVEGDGADTNEQAPSNDGSSKGDQLIGKAIEALEAAPSIVAQVKHEARFFGQLLVGDGTYQQLNDPEGVMTRLEITVQTDQQVTSLRHISNGKFLHILEQSDLGQTVGRVDLRAIRDADESAPTDSARSPSLVNSIAIGGLPRLLAELQRNFKFRAPQAIMFQNVPVWAVAGEWKAARLQTLFPSVKGIVRANGTVNVDRLPQYVPNRVFVLLGRDGLFPYRIEYHKDTDSSQNRTGTNAAQSTALLTMDLYRVQIGMPIEPRTFFYNPGGHQKVDDRTAQFTKTLR
ncbi:MAG: hypothetical protein KDB27_04075 [Planctomycetales bacterium]|nr:hypothetical protein [Planctomycetales bacterium]